jgi:hypothetical protein
MKAYVQKSKARFSRCLQSLRLGFGSVSTAATRIGAVVYAKSRGHTRRKSRQYRLTSRASGTFWRIRVDVWCYACLSQFHNHTWGYDGKPDGLL